MRDRIADGIFHRINLMLHSIASAAGQSECWSTACSEMMTGPLGMVIGCMWENPEVIAPQNYPFLLRDLHPI